MPVAKIMRVFGRIFRYAGILLSVMTFIVNHEGMVYQKNLCKYVQDLFGNEEKLTLTGCGKRLKRIH